MTEYCVNVTSKCNWDCEYCIVDTKNKREPDFNKTKEIINKIPNNSLVMLSGGEPGTLKKEYMEELFDILRIKNCRIQINTNGLFFENFLYLDKYICHYLYHCSENLDDIVKIPNVSPYKLCYIIVVTDNNLEKLEDFINNNTHIRLKILLGHNKKGQKTLSIKNKLSIFTKYKSCIDNSITSSFDAHILGY